MEIIAFCFATQRDSNPLEFNYSLITDTTRRSNPQVSQTLYVKLGLKLKRLPVKILCGHGVIAHHVMYVSFLGGDIAAVR